LSLLLKKATINFDVAKDGEQALQLYNANDYDIVLTDINIPKITGDQVAANIRKMSNKQKSIVPIVALTASIIGDDTDQYFKMGVNDLLIKPFKEADFTAMLHKYLD
jgi:CheY-like chemotaxis protein